MKKTIAAYLLKLLEEPKEKPVRTHKPKGIPVFVMGTLAYYV